MQWLFSWQVSLFSCARMPIPAMSFISKCMLIFTRNSIYKQIYKYSLIRLFFICFNSARGWLNHHPLISIRVIAQEARLSQFAKPSRCRNQRSASGIGKCHGGEKIFLRVGRSLVVTEVGKGAYRYGDEVFSLGRKLPNTLKGREPYRWTGLIFFCRLPILYSDEGWMSGCVGTTWNRSLLENLKPAPP